MSNFVVTVICVTLVVAFVLTFFVRGMQHLLSPDLRKTYIWVALGVTIIVVLAKCSQ